jgi:hypothetical protein
MAFLTLTAPGGSVHRLPSGDICPCVANNRPLGEWNAESGQAWSWLVTYLRRHYDPELQFFRGVEVQSRGALHFHVLIRSSGSAMARMRAEFAVKDPTKGLRALVISRGFGHSVDLKVFDGSPEAVRRLSNYVAKYVSKAVDDRHEVPWTPGGDKPRGVCRATFRPWSASRSWGKTMRELRAAQVVFMRRSCSTPPMTASGVVAAVRPLEPNTDRYTAQAATGPP